MKNPCSLTIKTLASLPFLTLSLLGLSTSLSPASALQFRSLDGSGNNLENPTWGQSNTPFLRLTPPVYQDGFASPRSQGVGGQDLPNPRDISNVVIRQTQLQTNSLHLSDWIWQWGQFIDHDLDLNEPPSSSPSNPIPVNPTDVATGLPDPLYTPSGLPFQRNEAVPGTGTEPGNPRQQINRLTAYIDGSQVYGSDLATATALRTFSGGKLKSQVVNGEELLPSVSQAPVTTANPLGLPPDLLFAAGDPRSNEQIGLSAIHTLFVREHNRLTTEFAARLLDESDPLVSLFEDSDLSEDEFLFQAARKVVGAAIQVVTYNEFLPLLVGVNALEPYGGYDGTIDASVSNEFANAAFRLGHTLLSPQLLLVSNDRYLLDQVSLSDAFFNSQKIFDDGIDSLLMGLASQKAQEFDHKIVDDVRNTLFAAGSGGRDLASVNIARGREVGLPSLNGVRAALGLTPYTSLAEINPEAPEVASRLGAIYASVEDVDIWVGGIAERHYSPEALLGETFRTIVLDQFRRSRDGDRFFYLNDPELAILAPDISWLRLSDLISRNSTATNIQGNAFLYTEGLKATPEPSNLLALMALGLSWISWVKCSTRYN